MNDIIIRAKLAIAYRHLKDSSDAYDKGCMEIKKLLAGTPDTIKNFDDGHIKLLGQAITVGDLRELLSGDDDSVSFGFRNQPLQALHEVRYGDDVCVVFQ